jgi:N-formylmaleamate deformylase
VIFTVKGCDMLEYTEDYLSIKGVKIHYYRTGGEKPPFILLHGATDNGLVWTPLAELLSTKYDIIMPDAQGHGLSDRLDKNFSFRSHTNQIAELIKQLGLKKPIIMGHSMGANTTANVAVEYPFLPGAIILEDPPWASLTPPSPEDARESAKQHEDFVNFLIGLNKLPLEKIIEESKKRDPRWSDEERLLWAKAKQQFDPSLFSMTVINPQLYSEIVPRINCPTLLIIAEYGIVSKETAENVSKFWKSRYPYKWVQIKGTTHNIRRDNFPAYRDALFDFLKDLPD